MSPLIFIHGAMSDSRVWRTLLDRLALDRPVHANDLAGHGARLHAEAPFSLARFASDTAQFARSLPGSSLPILVGWSLGASVALKVVAMGQVAAGAILVGATPQLIADETFSHGQSPAAAALRERGLTTAYEATARQFARAVSGSDPRAEALLAESALDADPQVAIAVFRDAGHQSLLPHLAEIQTPLRLIHGSRDTIVHPEAAFEIARHTPGAAAPHIIPDAGHAPFLTHPEAFDSAFASALDAIGDRAFRNVPAGNGKMDG